ncbi:hypothetical protein ACFZBU_41340 [Embleya sp. NPDC008237]|uniref:hypothetical protein n=1 Tax=Embleya sp. NPDC008237 TaxID=3363978 RepID=UPI0036ECDE83
MFVGPRPKQRRLQSGCRAGAVEVIAEHVREFFDVLGVPAVPGLDRFGPLARLAQASAGSARST